MGALVGFVVLSAMAASFSLFVPERDGRIDFHRPAQGICNDAIGPPVSAGACNSQTELLLGFGRGSGLGRRRLALELQ